MDVVYYLDYDFIITPKTLACFRFNLIDAVLRELMIYCKTDPDFSNLVLDDLELYDPLDRTSYVDEGVTYHPLACFGDHEFYRPPAADFDA